MIKNKKLSEYLNGKSFEERFGKEKALELKKKLSKNASRSWVEKYDSKTLAIMKAKAKNNFVKYNKDRIWSKDKIKKAVLNYYKNVDKLYKNDFWKPNGKPLPSARVVQKVFGSLDIMANECGVKFYKHNRKEYLKNNPEVVKKIIKNNKCFRKGLTYEKRFDKKQDNKIRNKLRKHMLKRFETEEVWNKGLKGQQEAWNKGLTKEDHEGIHKMSKARIEFMKNNKGNFISSQEKKVTKFLKKQNIVFKPQHYVSDIKDKYLSDIFIPHKKIIIEVDGEYWHSFVNRKELDERRTQQMLNKDYIVLRFSDKDVDNNFEMVKEQILQVV